MICLASTSRVIAALSFAARVLPDARRPFHAVSNGVEEALERHRVRFAAVLFTQVALLDQLANPGMRGSERHSMQPAFAPRAPCSLVTPVASSLVSAQLGYLGVFLRELVHHVGRQGHGYALRGVVSADKVAVSADTEPRPIGVIGRDRRCASPRP